VLSRYLWQLKTVVFQHWCLICVALLKARRITDAENTPAYCTLAPIRLEKSFIVLTLCH
jgi:hypothetical protein